MENLNKHTQGSKKIFLRKEIEPERLGEEIYSDDILCQYSVYLVRKFEEETDYQDLAQMERLLADLPERFNEDFQDIVAKNMYVRTTQKSVYVTLLLALPQPLSKIQIVELKDWMGSVDIPSPALEHVSNFSGSSTTASDDQMVREWQETNSEVLLLTEMMNQFNESLSDVYAEIQAVKTKKTPPVMKVVKSESAAKKVLEEETLNGQRIDELAAKVDKIMADFETFKQETAVRLEKAEQPAPAKRTPPKFKIYFDGKGGKKPSLEQRLDKTLEQLAALSSKSEFSQREIEKLGMKIEREARKTKELYRNQSGTAKVAENTTTLEEKMALTSEEVISISQQLQEINSKLSTVETKVSKVEQTPEEIEQKVMDHGKLQQTASETMKLNQVIDQLSEKLETVESDLTSVKRKEIPVVKLKKSETVKKLSDQHQKDQDQLMANAVEIKKLSQTVGKVDVQLIQAHQKIAELEQKIRLGGTVPAAAPRSQTQPMQQTQQPAAAPPVYSNQPPTQPMNVQPPAPQPQRPVSQPVNAQAGAGELGDTRRFPTKETFLQASRPIPNYRGANQPQPQNVPQTPVVEETPTVTLAIEEMLDRVSDHPKRTEPVSRPVPERSQVATTSLRRLKKLENDIFTSFSKIKSGIGSRGMVAKEDFYANIRQIEVLPYLWSTIHTENGPQQDILLNGQLSCQKLIDAVPKFLEEVEEIASKRKVMGKWIYCPKEVEQRMEGYKLLNEYFELTLSNRPVR
ncbi:hypothetical protein [Enterococcus sp. LJL51]|uniref:hypothetical protein n=1 Tax=Enterococcus sp. LJL51 TaxID=3416656 RepID=UPI003CFA80C1